ncbi:cellulose binding domain-containing protein [Streptomyces sp. TLI_185]|uniref:cellulose binding domain-containing protein n=1 Tax=Streptomyces sp. TLI_185 TaxID=2485151 RepID=UPI0021A6C7C4|nr:cellulose binding domain-containing protein [Streptomyces sp. TLI_185]
MLYSKWWSDTSEPPVLTVRYRTSTPATTALAKPWLEVINTSRQTVDLSDVTLRYYYTADDAPAYGSNCVQTSIGCSNVTLRTLKAAPSDAAGPDADHYLQIGFTAAAGTLARGRSSEGIGLQLYRVDHEKLNQVNDRSFKSADVTYTPSKLVTAYVRGALVWGQEPNGRTPGPSSPARTPRQAADAPGSGILFDDFDYAGPEDPALAVNGWEARSGEGGPGVKGSWSKDGVSFPAGEKGDGDQALQLRAATDGTTRGTLQSEFHRTRPTVLTGTLVARVYFSDKPTNGSDGDHISESFFTISPDHASSRYSELDYEYMPNGGWGRLGPRLDTTSWRSSERGDRVTGSHGLKLGGWHTMVITTAQDGATTYSVDGQRLFTNSSSYSPREHMSVNFSTWFIDLPFKGVSRTWDMRVDWLYYQSGRAVSVDNVQKTVAGFTAAGTNFVNTLPKR